MPTGDRARNWGGEEQRPSNADVDEAEKNGKQQPPFRLYPRKGEDFRRAPSVENSRRESPHALERMPGVGGRHSVSSRRPGRQRVRPQGHSPSCSRAALRRRQVPATVVSRAASWCGIIRWWRSDDRPDFLWWRLGFGAPSESPRRERRGGSHFRNASASLYTSNPNANSS